MTLLADLTKQGCFVTPQYPPFFGEKQLNIKLDCTQNSSKDDEMMVRRVEQAAKVFQLCNAPAMEAASRIFHRWDMICSWHDNHNDNDGNQDDDALVIGQEPQQQAVFFYRRLLRAESYRKALVWQKRLIIIILRYHDCGRDPSLRYQVTRIQILNQGTCPSFWPPTKSPSCSLSVDLQGCPAQGLFLLLLLLLSSSSSPPLLLLSSSSPLPLLSFLTFHIIGEC